MYFTKKLFLSLGIFTLFAGLFFAPGTTFAQQEVGTSAIQKINDNTYIYYYGQTCGYCIKVENYLKESGVDQWITIIPKEVSLQVNKENREELLTTAEALGVPLSKVGTPFIVVVAPDGSKSTLAGEVEVLDHFKILEQEIKALNAETPGTSETIETIDTIPTIETNDPIQTTNDIVQPIDKKLLLIATIVLIVIIASIRIFVRKSKK